MAPNGTGPGWIIRVASHDVDVKLGGDISENSDVELPHLPPRRLAYGAHREAGQIDFPQQSQSLVRRQILQLPRVRDTRYQDQPRPTDVRVQPQLT